MGTRSAGSTSRINNFCIRAKRGDSVSASPSSGAKQTTQPGCSSCVSNPDPSAFSETEGAGARADRFRARSHSSPSVLPSNLGGTPDEAMLPQSAFFADATLHRDARLGAPQDPSARETRAREDEEALCGMRRTDKSVLQSPEYAEVGHRLREMLEDLSTGGRKLCKWSKPLTEGFRCCALSKGRHRFVANPATWEVGVRGGTSLRPPVPTLLLAIPGSISGAGPLACPGRHPRCQSSARAVATKRGGQPDGPARRSRGLSWTHALSRRRCARQTNSRANIGQEDQRVETQA